MITKEEYLLNPTATSSLSYWKTNSIKTETKIFLIDSVTSDKKNKYFFKMIHYLNNIENVKLDDRFKFTNISDLGYVGHINSCYDDICVSLEELKQYKNRETYNPNLWVAIKDKKDNIVATGIAEYDKEIGEGIIEWVQVSPKYRRNGLGKIIINELLNRLKVLAKFVTVSGDFNNPNKPMLLYEKCGFTNMRIWQIGE